ALHVFGLVDTSGLARLLDRLPIRRHEPPGLLPTILVDRCLANPGILAKQLLQVLCVCEVDKKHNQAAANPHESQKSRVSRGEPEAVPTLDDALQTIPNGGNHGFSSNSF